MRNFAVDSLIFYTHCMYLPFHLISQRARSALFKQFQIQYTSEIVRLNVPKKIVLKGRQFDQLTDN